LEKQEATFYLDGVNLLTYSFSTIQYISLLFLWLYKTVDCALNLLANKGWHWAIAQLRTLEGTLIIM